MAGASPLGVSRMELLRHAGFLITMNTYTQALTDDKRSAHRDVIRLVVTATGTFENGGECVSALFCWRPRRDLNSCYRRERAIAKRNSNKPQGRGRTGWRSRNSKKQLIVSPMCPQLLTLALS